MVLYIVSVNYSLRICSHLIPAPMQDEEEEEEWFAEEVSNRHRSRSLTFHLNSCIVYLGRGV